MCTWTFSDIEGGPAGMGNIDVDPLFVSVPTKNFHLQQTSPVKDKADPSATVTDDIDRDHRPQGSGFDIGADEIK
jgi:hypothetical protein